MIDGGTQPAETLRQIIDRYPSVTFSSEPDEGIYDGMNKGLRRSRGDFVWFLNGGDESCVGNEEALFDLFEENPDKLILAGFYLRAANRSIRRSPRGSSYISHGLPTSHQAIFYPGVNARKAQYNLEYKVSADYDFTARMLKEGVQAVVSSLPVAIFDVGGMSETNARQIAVEAERVQRSVLGLGWLSRQKSQLRHNVSRKLRLVLSTYVAIKNRAR